MLLKDAVNLPTTKRFSFYSLFQSICHSWLSIATLYFQTAGISIVQPKNATIREGETLSINCTLSANSTNVSSLNFTWRKGGEGSVVGQSSQLTIVNISRTDSGNYSCVATNGTAAWTAVATITVFCKYTTIDY